MAHLTLHHVASLVVLSALAGCGGGPETNTGGGGTTTSTPTGGGGTGGTGTSGSGTGATAGTETGGTGGTGGTTTTTGTGGSISGCPVTCEMFGGTCVVNGCVFPDDIAFALLQELKTTPQGGQLMESASGGVSFLAAGTVLQGFAVLAEEGPCQVISFGMVDPPPMFDAGTATFDGPNMPATMLTPPYSTSFMPAEIFSPGDVLQLTVAGGPDFPGFSSQVTAPLDIVVTAPTIQQSKPLVVTWSPPEPPDQVSVVAGGNAKQIVCYPSAPGSIEIPVSLLSQLDPPSGGGISLVSGLRWNYAQSDVAPGAQGFFLAYEWSIVMTDYIP